MLGWMAGVLVRRRWQVVVSALVAVAAAGAAGRGVASRLSQGGFVDPGSESARATRLLERGFGQGDPNLVPLVRAPAGASVDDPEVAEVGRAITARLGAEPGVSDVVSYWTSGAPPLRSGDGRMALALGRIEGSQDEVHDRVRAIAPRYRGAHNGVEVGVGGFAEVLREVNDQVEHDLVRAEVIAFPVVLVLLLVVFGGPVAASLPLAIGALAVVGTFAVLRGLAGITEVSIFSLNLTTGMGLGLAIDYSLFVVSRFREEVAEGVDAASAAVATVATAGRTVLFSALTVAVALAALLVFPLAFLRSFAYAGIAVVLLAALGAVVVLPALLAVLGRRVDAGAVRRKRVATAEGGWHRLAMFVMRRPVPVIAAASVLLAVLGWPATRMRLSLPDERVLPATAPARRVHEDIRRNFAAGEISALSVVAPGAGHPRALSALDRYAAALSATTGVARVDGPTGSYLGGRRVLPPGPLSARFAGAAGAWLRVVPGVEPISEDGERLVRAVRAVRPPFPVMVGGPSAELVDEKASMFGRLPWALGLVALATFALLFLSFGSVVVPAKALVVNVASLSATFGAAVWVFQDGHLAGLLGFTPTGALELTMPVLMFCIAFGLSMDYEVFLLSRIREEYERTGDNVMAVAMGLERTGRIVTAAAVLLAVVFVVFASSEIVFIKLFGVGLATAVVMDATVVRCTLVPAFMRLAGAANWWAPAWMRRVHARFGFGHEGGPRSSADQLDAVAGRRQ